ncbi:MAG: hypothetical protein AAF266_01920 [Planctomycetota bacterium]
MSLPKSLAIAAALIASPVFVFAHGPGFLSDPVVTYTNGMRLASSTSTRSHNVYWRCDPGHIGYCDGQLHSPCRNDWRSLGTRCHGQYVPPYTPMGPTGTEGLHTADGMEHGDGESLGLLGQTALRAGEAGAALPAGEAVPSFGQPTANPNANGGIWLDALQTIGRKMMDTPGN